MPTHTFYRNKYVRFLKLVGVICLIIGAGIGITLPPRYQLPASVQATAAVRQFTLKELNNYDGSDVSLPIYLAFSGNVYDVSNGKKFYEPGGVYHYLAGRDASVELHIAGGEIIKRKYPVVGRLISDEVALIN